MFSTNLETVHVHIKNCLLNNSRYNLDPSETVNDDEVWSALERVNMKQPIKDMEKGLETLIEGAGNETLLSPSLNDA